MSDSERILLHQLINREPVVSKSSSATSCTCKGAGVDYDAEASTDLHEAHAALMAGIEAGDLEAISDAAELIGHHAEDLQGVGGSLKQVSKAGSELVIYGPASVSIVDSEGDKITGPALKGALPSLLRRKNLSLEHMDIQPGEILEKWDAPDGTTWRTEVREVTKQDLEDYPRLKKSGAEEGDDALFIVAKVFDDTKFSKDVRERILKGELECFSISGQAIAESTEQKCEGYECKLVNVIEKLDLSAVTLCEQGMNSGASFRVLSKAMKRDLRERDLMQKSNDGFPGGFAGAVKALMARQGKDGAELCDCVRKRAGKLKATLDKYDPGEDEAEVYGLLAALVDAAEEEEPEAVAELYEQFVALLAPPEAPEEASEPDEVPAEPGADDSMEDTPSPDSAVTKRDPQADHQKIELPHGTPSNPSAKPDHGKVHEDNATNDTEENTAYPSDTDRLEDAAPRVPVASEDKDGDAGELFIEEITKSLEVLAKECEIHDDEDAPEDPTTEDLAQETESLDLSALRELGESLVAEDDDVVMKPAPEGVDEAKYDSCVEQVEEEGDAENAYAVCADALKTKNHASGHTQDLNAHKQHAATHGWDATYKTGCPTCFKLSRSYDNPRAYFDTAQHLRKTGVLQLGRLSPRDVPTFRKERAVFDELEPLTGSA